MILFTVSVIGVEEKDRMEKYGVRSWYWCSGRCWWWLYVISEGQYSTNQYSAVDLFPTCSKLSCPHWEARALS